MKRIIATLLLSTLALAQTSTTIETTSPKNAKLQAQLEQIAKEHKGKVALYAENLKTKDTVAIDPDTPVQTASTIKLALFVEAFHQIKDGKKRLDDKITLKKEDQVGGSGIFPFLTTPTELRFEDVLTFMIINSDNTGTNLAIDHLGLEPTNKRMADMGLKNTYLYKKVFKPAEGPMPADQKKFGLGKTTAREMARLIASIAQCEVGDDALCKKMVSIMKNQQYRESIPRYIETADTSEVLSGIANKTGALNALRADVAIVYTSAGPIVISAYTYENEDKRWNPDNQGYITMAKLAKAIIDAWAPKGVDPKADKAAEKK